jgi:hypothetical protein
MAMRTTLKLSELSNMQPERRAAALDELVIAANQSPNGGLEALESEINEFEARYEMSSDELLERLNADRQEETAEIASWLIRLDLRRRIREREARTE